MLCKRSADRAVPTVSLSWRPVDTRHSAGTEVPERKHTPSNIASELITPNKPGSFKILILTAFFASFIHFILLKLFQIRTTYSGWSAGATGLHQSIWQQQRWVGLIPAGDGDGSQELIVGMGKATRSVGTSKEIVLRKRLRVPVQYLCNLPVEMHQDQFCYCW